MAGLSLYADPSLYDLVIPAGSSEKFYLSEAEKRGKGPVLELACGTGRVAIPLARAGQEMVGVDVSPAMLAKAAEKAAAAGVCLTLIEGDMRHLNLGDRRFPLIFITENSFLHLHTTEDFAACLAGVRRYLAPDGVFIFDIFVPGLHILGRDPKQRFLIGRFQDPTRGEITVEETTDYDAGTQIIRSTWYWSTPAQPDFRVTPLNLRQIFPMELPLLIEASGFDMKVR
jgi:SAM-dependent methyltransferase